MKIKFIITLLLSLSLASCTSNIRFASKAKYTKDYIADDIPQNFASFKRKSTVNDKRIEYGSGYGTNKSNINPNKDYGFGTFLNEGLDPWQMKLVSETDKWLGTPYLYGGTDENGIDCSAFVQNVFAGLGINLPRTAALQFEATDKISDNERKPGDLIFFQKKDNISHVGIYMGNDIVVHASTSRGVMYEDLYCSFFSNSFAGFGRINTKSNQLGFLSGK